MSNFVIFLGVVASFFCLADIAKADTQITVFGDKDKGPATCYTGWLHGFGDGDVLDPALMAPLRTQSWRIGHWNQYDQAAQFSESVTFVLSDTWGYSRNPAEDWEAFEKYCAKMVQYSINENKPVDYWDLWNEPNYSGFWKGTYDELLETLHRSYTIIKSIDPNAKIMGPSLGTFHGSGETFPQGTLEIVQDMDSRYGIRFDVVSWHEIQDFPWVIPVHTNQLHLLLKTMEPAYAPLLNINEYTKPPTIMIPAVLLWSIYNFDKADIDFVSLACWDTMHKQCDPPEIFSTCGKGVNGCFMDDNTTPMQNYWLWKFHAEESNGGLRLAVKEPDYKTFVVASKHDDTKTVYMMLGVMGRNKQTDTVTITIENYPYSDEKFVVEKSYLPSVHEVCGNNPDNAMAKPWPQGPVDAGSETVKVKDGNVAITLEDVPDLSVYFLKIMPKK